MDIKVRRGQEANKGGSMSGNNPKLSFDVTVVLSDEEKALIEKYYDPSLVGIENRSIEMTGGNSAMEVDQIEISLSHFHLEFHTDNGYEKVGYLRGFEIEVIQALSSAIESLKELASWEGESTIEV